LRLSSLRSPKIISLALTAVLLGLLMGCANIVPPEGGKKDESAPVLLSMTPGDSSLNTRIAKIEMVFNKFMEINDLENNLQLSPLLPISPTVESNGKKVKISIVDSQLIENTTYRIALGNALVDNREATPYKDFVFTFSTGGYFDSLQLQGNVVDAATGRPDTATTVVLYQQSDIDSAVLRKKPFYATKVDASGHFSFSALPMRPFHIYAVQDLNKSYTYDYGTEKIGFIANRVTPAYNSDTTYTFYIFPEQVDTLQTQGDIDSTVKTARKPLAQRGDRPGAGRGKGIGYRVNVDTTDRANRSFEITRPLVIDIFTEIATLDTGKVYLSYENGGIEVEAIQQTKVDSSKIKLSTQWISDKIYTLRLVKGWAKDTSGNELPPGKYFFRTKRDEDYGTLKIHVDKAYFGDGFLLYIYNDADSIYKMPITDSIVTIPLLQPGNYGMRIIQDDNKNRQWDAGNFFAKKQPEKVIQYNQEIILKAGWENELDFRQPVAGKPPTQAPKETEDKN